MARWKAARQQMMARKRVTNTQGQSAPAQERAAQPVSREVFSGARPEGTSGRLARRR